LKNSEFLLLDDELKPTAQTLSFFQESSNLTRYRSLESFFEKEGLRVDGTQLRALRKRVETRVEKTIEKAAFLLFHYYHQSGQWGNESEQQITVSFCRFLLNIPVDVPLIPDHFETLENVVREKNEEYGISRLTGEQAKQRYDSFNFKFLGLSIPGLQAQKVNHLLKFIGSEKRIVGVKYGFDTLFIVYKGYSKEISHHMIHVLQEEYQLSPNVIIPLAAFSGDREVFLREIAMTTIFHQKWMQFFEVDPREKEYIRFIRQRNISEGIKKACFDRYGVSSKSDLVVHQKQFIDDLLETVMYHELGHVVVQNEILPLSIGAFCEGTKCLGETIFMALIEILADFSPNLDGLKGPMQNFIDHSKTDVVHAERMFYMYFSDVWFYDTEDDYMFLYSDLMVLSLLRYVNDDGSINFKKMEHDIYFNPKKKENDKDTTRYVNQLFGFTIQSVRKMVKLFSSFRIPLGQDVVSYDQFQKAMLRAFETKNKTVDVKSYNYLSKNWTLTIRYLKDTYPDFKKAEELIKQIEKEILKRLFRSTAGDIVYQEYKGDHRSYIFDRCTDLGLVIHSEQS